AEVLVPGDRWMVDDVVAADPTVEAARTRHAQRSADVLHHRRLLVSPFAMGDAVHYRLTHGTLGQCPDAPDDQTPIEMHFGVVGPHGRESLRQLLEHGAARLVDPLFAVGAGCGASDEVECRRTPPCEEQRPGI